MIEVNGKSTGLYDSDKKPIRIGCIVRRYKDDKDDIHGSWVDYRVRARGMTPCLYYLRSERGQILPEGYTASILADEYDKKLMPFVNDLSALLPEENLTVVAVSFTV